MISTLPTGRLGQSLAVGLVLIAAALAWLAVANPLIGWYDQRAQTLAERTRFARHLSALVRELPAIERTARRLATSAPAQHTLLAGATNAIAGATLQQIVQTMATAGGAKLSSAETLPVQKDGAYRRIRLRITVTGSWPVLVHLLQAITHGPPDQPAMLVDNLRLTHAIRLVRSATTPFNAQFTVVAFRVASVHPTGIEPGKRSGRYNGSD